jgi:uncharacterized protein
LEGTRHEFNTIGKKGKAMGDLQFEWDEQNVHHLALHQIAPVEAEQVIRNRPLDLESLLRNGEQRLAQIGETDAGRVLIVITTMRDNKIRVVTAWPANRNYRRYFLSMKRNGDVGRTKEQDLRE